MSLLFGFIELFIVVGIFTGILAVIDFSAYIFKGIRIPKVEWLYFINIVILPAIFLLYDSGQGNVYVDEVAVFAPAHRLSLYALILCSLAAYYYSMFKTRKSPVMEIMVNCFLLICIVLNLIIIYHVLMCKDEFPLALCSIPIVLSFVMRLTGNHKKIINQTAVTSEQENPLVKACRNILHKKLFQQIPILIVICLPLLCVLSAILLLFGQQPDSMIKVFTQTYYHGFSELDPANLLIHDDHFLCNIAAKGHHKVVKPLRNGERQGHKIIVNRQLMVSNAFEELLEQRAPWLHKVGRGVYNAVGSRCASIYQVWGNRWISDVVYVMFKPLEWAFLLVLYVFDEKPENRIARQYITAVDKHKVITKSNKH